jgi:hypothetical protein
MRRRLASAEREVRLTLGLLKTMFCLGITGGLGVIVFSASRSYATLHDGSKLRVPFQIVDGRGNVLMRIDADDSNRRLRLFDASGQAAVELGSTPDGGVLNVNGSGSGSALLLANSDGGQLTVTGKHSTPIAWLGGRKDGGTLAFWDETGRKFVCMSAKKQSGHIEVIRSARAQGHTTSLGYRTLGHPRKAAGSQKQSSRAVVKAAGSQKQGQRCAAPAAGGREQEKDATAKAPAHAQEAEEAASTDPSARSADPAAGERVRVCVGGRYYHRPGCKRVRKQTKSITRTDAECLGWKPCPTCQP